MISYQNALSVLTEIASSREVSNEDVALGDAMGRLLMKPVLTTEEVPSFTNSAMDGFALSSADTQSATPMDPVQLPVLGLIAAGDTRAYENAHSDQPGIAVEIMTGAPVPQGICDSVVRIEDVQVERASDGRAISILISRPLKRGENVRLKGTDFTVGQTVLSSGTRIIPEHVLACASLGITKLNVKSRPRIAIISTGSELVSPDTALLVPGMIRNSTGPFLLAALRRVGVDANYLGVVSDDPAVYRRTLENALADGAEIILSTGAVSMGKYDFVPEVLAELGAVTHFHKAAIRPGKPVLFADLNRSRRGSVFFGVPGNPISTVVGLRFFVEPYLRALLRLPRELPIRARLSNSCQKPNGLRCFFKGWAKATESGIEVQSLKGQASYVVSALLEANCWVVLPEEGVEVAANSSVEIYPLQNAFERGVIE